jgi:FecR protein
MKKLQTLLGIALCGVFLNLGLTASAATDPNGFATVVRVKGFAQYSQDNGANWHPLLPGKYLNQGAWIHTGDDGVVDVVLGKAIDLPQAKWVPERISLSVDSPVRGMITYKPSAEQNVVRLMENTTLAIDKLTTTSSYADTVSDTELDLKKGSIYASVKKLPGASQYLVKTPTGIAGVRGTQFSAALNGDGTIKSVEVYHTQPGGGLMLAPNGATPPFQINAGQKWEPGDAGPVPIPPSRNNYLQLTFSAVQTIYIEVVNYDYDHTKVYESSDFGY